MSDPSRPALATGLGAAVLAISSAALFILLAAPLPPLVIAAGRVAVTAMALALLGWSQWRPAAAALRRGRVQLRIVVAAALLAVHFGAWIASLSMTTVPRSVTLVATQPLVAGLLGRLLGDRASPRLYVGALVAVVGTLVMVSDGEGGGLSFTASFNGGDALALLAAVAVSAYLVVGRSVRDVVPLRPYLSAVHAWAAVLLAVAVVFSTAGDWWPSVAVGSWLAVVYLGLVPGLIGHGLINWAVRYLPVHTVSLAVLFEPIGAMVLTGWILARPVTSLEMVGAAIILVGVGLGLPRR